jgi:hypothetical protein
MVDKLWNLNLIENIIRPRYLSRHNGNQENLNKDGMYRGADKSLARPGRKQATATEDFEFHTSYLYLQLEKY